MELFKRAVNESNIKAQIKADLIKHLEDCKCGDKPKATKPKSKSKISTSFAEYQKDLED